MNFFKVIQTILTMSHPAHESIHCFFCPMRCFFLILDIFYSPSLLSSTSSSSDAQAIWDNQSEHCWYSNGIIQLPKLQTKNCTIYIKLKHVVLIILPVVDKPFWLELCVALWSPLLCFVLPAFKPTLQGYTGTKCKLLSSTQRARVRTYYTCIHTVNLKTR